MINTDDFLEHYGVKGMRWGVRKQQAKRVSTDGKEANRILSKEKEQGIRSLTSHELRVINTRRDLETKFEKQNPKPPTLAAHGKKFAMEIATAAGIGTAAGLYKIATSEAGKAIATKGIDYVKSSPFLKLGVKSLPVNEQLKLF